MGDEISLNQVTAQYGDSQKVRDYFNIADHDKSGTLSAAEQEVLTAALAGQPGGSGKFISVGGVTFFASDVTYIKTNENASQKGAFDYTVAFDKYGSSISYDTQSVDDYAGGLVHFEEVDGDFIRTNIHGIKDGDGFVFNNEAGCYQNLVISDYKANKINGKGSTDVTYVIREKH